MSGNRFDFLEFSDDRQPERPAAPDDGIEETGINASPAGLRGLVGPDGRPVSEVGASSDPRGYQDFLDQNQSDDPLNGPRDQESRGATMRPMEVIGERGERAGQFNFPTGIAVDSRGILFVADSYNHRIQRITPDGAVSAIGSKGIGYAQFLSPQDVAVDRRDAFYVVEQGNHRVQKFSATGRQELIFGRRGHLPGEFFGPTSIAVSPMSGDIYVADTGNFRVQRFDQKGRFLSQITSSGKGLISPQSVEVDHHENVYIVDTLGHRIIQCDPTGREFLAIGRRRRTDTDWIDAPFIEPRACAVDIAGFLFVADGGEPLGQEGKPAGRIHIVDPISRRNETAIEHLGRNLDRMTRPTGIAIAPAFTPDPQTGLLRNEIYVADTMNHRIIRMGWVG
ncbi:MAG: NHL repeat-containing protein [Capsulimonas sp.]|uniref:NHL repeat-containing protein n=1 Tax=Capsulimonas sp. TaxID=2494211 RepID=UPI003266DCF6